MVSVLIVEDDFMLGLINRKNVEMLGYKVVAAVTTGKEAIEAVKKYAPDVILMDLRLDGGMDGIETMEEIGKFSQVPVIYLTGNSDKASKERAAKTNVISFCVKPVHFEELALILSTIKKAT